MKHNIIYLFFSVFILSGCMVGPRFSAPEMETPETYLYDSVSADTIINLEWWTLFNDNILDTLITIALKENKDVQIAASRVLEAAFVVGYNRADLFPSLGYTGNAGYGNMTSSGAVLADESASYLGLGNVYWELDFWGKYRRATEAAKASLAASEYGKRSIEVSLIAAVATNYFQLVDYKARLKISEETLLSRKESTRIIGERFDKGIVPEIDLNQAQIQEAIAAAAVPFYTRQVANLEHALSILLGRFPKGFETALLIDLQKPDSIPVGIPADLLLRRPDLLQAEQQLKAQNAQIGIAQAMRFPAISLTGALGVASSDLSNLLSADAFVWNISGRITGPIFNFGKNKRRVEIERERTEQVKLQYENSVLKAFREVEDALIGVTTVNDEFEAFQKQLIAAENASSLSRARYDGGVTSYLEVLETERTLFDTELQVADVYQRMLVSYVALYKALGGGWITPEEKTVSESNTKK